MRKIDVARQLFVLPLTLIGLMSWRTLPLDLSGRVIKAATRTSLVELAVQPASGVVANGRIAFVSSEAGSVNNAEIYTMNSDGSDRRRLTFDPADDSDPVWSPDGTKIAFARSVAPGNLLSPGIYVMNADGGDQRRLTAPAINSNPSAPTWSPDGTKIAFVDFSNFSRHSSVIVMNADGSDQRPIYGHGVSQPAWSPDGLKLVGTDGTSLVLINIDGSNLTHITQPPTPFDPATYFVDYEPNWSPDGSKIVFTRYVDCDLNDCYSARLYVVNADGSNPTNLTRQSAPGNAPAWSPDGRKIVLGGGDLSVINPDGSGLTNLTNTNDRSEGSPSWQPLSLPPTANPIDDPEFFARQQYLDFLAREPEQSGLDDWLRVLHNCANGDSECLHQARLTTSAAFFGSPEFQLKGYFIFRFYKVAFGRLPAYDEIMPDMQSVSGSTPAEVYARKAMFSNSFAQRQGFGNDFGALSNADYVMALLRRYQLASITAPDPAAPDGTAKVTLTRADLVARLDSNSLTRAQALRVVADSDEVLAAEFNNAFVAMQYYGYLRRTPEVAGYNAWLNYLSAHPADFREMVRGFVDSIEYRRRFGQP